MFRRGKNTKVVPMALSVQTEKIINVTDDQKQNS